MAERQTGRKCRSAKSSRPGFSGMFWRAFSLGISNPKDILFFVAFLPQFIDPASAFLPQLITMIVSWCVLDLICKLFYGGSAQLVAPWLQKAGAYRSSTASLQAFLSPPAVLSC
ncbi:LysE family transporter [Aliamphritea spongicola]|nr:LysE family transporter [Aliamphritea spongicola]